MTDFEKAVTKHLGLLSVGLGGSVAFAPTHFLYYAVPVSFAWFGALLMWAVLADRHGFSKPTEKAPVVGDFLLPVFVGHFAYILIAVPAALGLLVRNFL